jgi:hypothetical protein
MPKSASLATSGTLRVRSAIPSTTRNTLLEQTSCAVALTPPNPLPIRRQTSSTTTRAANSLSTASHHGSRACGTAPPNSISALILASHPTLLLHHLLYVLAIVRTHTPHLDTHHVGSIGHIEAVTRTIDPSLHERDRRRRSTCSCPRRVSSSHPKRMACVRIDSPRTLPTRPSQS